MATAREWADAYLAQAEQDLTAAKALQGQAPSTLAMLLQMVLEKAGKAALLRSGQMQVPDITHTHKAASTLIALLRRNRRYLAELGDGNAFAWNDVLPLVRELERAHPQLADGRPQLEYPWEDPESGEIRWPARDLPIAQRLASPRSREGARLLKFTTELLARVPLLFG